MRRAIISLIGNILENNRSGVGLLVYLLTIIGHIAIRGIRGIDIKLRFSLETPFSINFKNTTESVANAIYLNFFK